MKLVCRLSPDAVVVEDPDAPRLHYIDDNMLKTPPIAVQQTKREIVSMAGIAIENVYRALDTITRLDFSEKELFARQENELNFLNREIVNFVVKLSDRQGLGEKDHLFLATTYRTVRDLERIGDYAENIMEYAEILKEENKVFSDDALYEIKGLRQLISNLYKRVIEAYNKEDKECLTLACEIEENIDDYTKMMEDNHIERLTKGICTPSVGAQYLSLSSNVERIADHLINVANSITHWD